MKLLANPIVWRTALVFFAATFAFVIGRLLMKQMRSRIEDERSFAEPNPSAESFPLETYHAVIQQLKQQKHELLASQLVERRRAKTTENISATLLSSLSCGVLFFNTSGLVRQANTAAKSILGFASPVGMSASELFRGATLQRSSKTDEPAPTLVEAVVNTLRATSVLRRVEADYVTPSGEERVLDVTVSPVYAANAELLGAACVINDQTGIVQMQRRQELRGEMSAEMALQLRNSLATISGYARNLAANQDPGAAEQLAIDIASEAEHLQRTIGGFLASAKAAGTASGAG